MSIYLSVCMSVCLPICLSVFLSVCLSICLSVCVTCVYYMYIIVRNKNGNNRNNNNKQNNSNKIIIFMFFFPKILVPDNPLGLVTGDSQFMDMDMIPYTTGSTSSCNHHLRFRYHPFPGKFQGFEGHSSGLKQSIVGKSPANFGAFACTNYTLETLGGRGIQNQHNKQELHGLPWFTALRNQYQAWSMRGTSSFPL